MSTPLSRSRGRGLSSAAPALGAEPQAGVALPLVVTTPTAVSLIFRLEPIEKQGQTAPSSCDTSPLSGSTRHAGE